MRELVAGTGIVLTANSEYVLGRPRIHEIEVKYVTDVNTLTANLLAGTVDVTSLVGSVDLGLQLRDQWRAGTVAFNLGSDVWVALFPQFVDPRPAIVADLQLRRALVHAVDRQEVVDTLVAGMSRVPHSFLSPNHAIYRDIEAAAPGTITIRWEPLRSSNPAAIGRARMGPIGTRQTGGLNWRCAAGRRSRPRNRRRLLQTTGSDWARMPPRSGIHPSVRRARSS